MKAVSGRPAPLVSLNVKVRPEATAKGAVILSRREGVVNVVETFPGETDPDLAGLFVVRVERPAARKVASALRRDPRVELVEMAPVRKLRV